MKIAVIINPQTRQRQIKGLDSLIESKFGGSLVSVARTRYAGHATKLAAACAHDGADTIVAVGGDGTVNEILNGIIGKPVTLGLLPAGTANDLAGYYGIPTELNLACDVVLDRKTRAADVIRVNDWYYLTAGGFGLPSAALAFVEAMRRGHFLGRLAASLIGNKLYMLGVICACRKARRLGPSVSIHSFGSTQRVNVFSLIVSNNPRIGGSFNVTPDAVNDDGQFDLCVIENCTSRLVLLGAMLRTLTGTHHHMKNVTISRADRITIDAAEPLPFFGDGQFTHPSNRLDLEIIPRAIRIVVPRDGGGRHVD